MSKQPVVCFFGVDDAKGKWAKKYSSMTPLFYKDDERLKQILVEKRPGFLISVGPNWTQFRNLGSQLSAEYRKRWIHYASLDELSEQSIYNSWMISIFNQVSQTGLDPVSPFISVFTTSYKSQHRIQRPLRSLLNSTYTNWEFVIFDDTPSTYNDDENWKMLNKISSIDPRIRIFRSNANSGLIGEVKYSAAQLCRGTLLAEVDHDDDLVPECLQTIVNASREFPDAAFFYTDCVEPNENTGECATYGSLWGLGYGSYYKQKYDNNHNAKTPPGVKRFHELTPYEYNAIHPTPGTVHPCGPVGTAFREPSAALAYPGHFPQGWEGRWLTVERTPNLNPTVLRHIVGAPNHIRVWKKSVYQEVGGHNWNLWVVDDYELILRTFLHKNQGQKKLDLKAQQQKIVYIPKMTYLQYRNEGGNNFTFIRNADIQKLVGQISGFYHDRIHDRITEIGVKDQLTDFNKVVWEQDPLWVEPRLSSIMGIDDWNESKEKIITIVLSTHYSKNLQKTIESVLRQSYLSWDLIIVGDKSPNLDKVMNNVMPWCDDRVRWWNLETNYRDNGVTAKNYALRCLVRTPLITYIDEKEEWTPDHLQKLLTAWVANANYITLPKSEEKPNDTENTETKSENTKSENTETKSENKSKGVWCLHKLDLLTKYGYWKKDLEELMSRWENNKSNDAQENKGPTKEKTENNDDNEDNENSSSIEYIVEDNESEDEGSDDKDSDSESKEIKNNEKSNDKESDKDSDKESDGEKIIIPNPSPKPNSKNRRRKNRRHFRK